jgi:hypothetical protein
VFQQDIDRKVSKARRRTPHRVDRCVSTTTVTKRRCACLSRRKRPARSSRATSACFLRLPAVDAFLRAHVETTRALKTHIDATLRARAADDLKRTAKDLMDDAELMYADHRYDDALVVASKVRALMEDETSGEPLLAALAAERGTEALAPRARRRPRR